MKDIAHLRKSYERAELNETASQADPMQQFDQWLQEAIRAEVPLAETFGYATDIRSMSQGQGTFTMELSCYRKVDRKSVV